MELKFLILKNKKIVDFLSNIDKKIEITQLQFSEMTQLKKGLLQQMLILLYMLHKILKKINSW